MKFEKVSMEQYLEASKSDKYIFNSIVYKLEDLSSRGHIVFTDSFKELRESSMEKIYEDIKIPTRATKKSAGYDFFSPYDFILGPGETIKLATGIRVLLDDDKFLMCLPRSSHGFKARIQLDNTVGIIDADYSDSDNEGHIYVKLTNDSHTGDYVAIKKGDGIFQAIIVPYFTVENDETTTLRNGGLGSTSNK